jgi:hypothetical protein
MLTRKISGRRRTTSYVTTTRIERVAAVTVAVRLEEGFEAGYTNNTFSVALVA